MEPLVSVIIPFYNTKIDWLSQSIESVINQTYKNLEIILINDGSCVDLTKILIKYRNKITYIHKINEGPGSSRNLGIKVASGAYIAFLDSDDLWLPDKLHEQISFMEKNGYQWSHTDYIRFWDMTNKETNVKCSLSGNIFPKILIWNPIATPCIIVKSAVFLENKNMRFANGKNIGEDSYLWQQIGEKIDLGYFPRALAKVRIHGKNAAFKAHLQLKCRGDSVEILKNYKNKFTNKFLYHYFLLLLKYCALMYRVLFLVTKAFKLSSISSEFIHKIAYVFPYLNFRLLRNLIYLIIFTNIFVF